MNYHISLDCRRNSKLQASLAALLLILVFGIPSSWAQEDQSIVVTTSKNTYGPGDTVNLSGTVNGGTPQQLVAIQVKDPKGNLILIRTVQTDQNGNFALEFKMPLTASSGNLNITASARISGFVVTQTKTITTPVPEFPASGLVLVVGIASLLIFYRILSTRVSRIRQGFGI